jgi:hypothetical protein
VRCAAALPFSCVEPRLKMKKPLASPRQDRSGDQHRRIPFQRRRIEETQRVVWIGIHVRWLPPARQVPRFGFQHYRRRECSQVIGDLDEIRSAERRGLQLALPNQLVFDQSSIAARVQPFEIAQLASDIQGLRLWPSDSHSRAVVCVGRVLRRGLDSKSDWGHKSTRGNRDLPSRRVVSNRCRE